MIQCPELIRSDIQTLTKESQSFPSEIKKYSPEQIWVAFERCGYSARAIPEYILKGGNIDIVPFHISLQEWQQFSPCRQESIRVMFSNPNAYYYRNRPPGQEPKFGSWSEEEEIAFHNRYQVFQHFGIAEKFWGLFAVPLQRFGYTCSSWCKTSYHPERLRGLPKPNIPNMTKEEFLEAAKQEAIQIVFDSILKSPDPSSLRLIAGDPSKPIKKIRTRNSISSSFKDTFIDEEIDDTPIMSRHQIKVRERKEHNFFEDSENEHEKEKTRKTYSPPGKKFHSTQRQNSEEKMNLALGARDQITGCPMRKPMMNRDGYVLDKDTWDLLARGKVVCPFEYSEIGPDDLMEITSENYMKYQPYIMNVYY